MRACHAANLYLIKVFIYGKEHATVSAVFHGVHEVDDAVGEQLIRLRFAQHALRENVGKHAGTVCRFLKGRIVKQYLEVICRELGKCERDAVELAGAH